MLFGRDLPLWLLTPVLLTALQVGGTPVERLLKSSRALLAQRNWKAAAASFEDVLKLAPKTVDAHIGLGLARWGAGDRTGGLEAFRHAAEADPASPAAHYNIALALRDSGEPARALASFRTALKLRPDYDEARLALGLTLQQSGAAVAAIAEYRTVIRRNPKSAEAHNWLGVAYMQKNRMAQAAGELRRAIQLQPDFVRAYNNLGSTLAQAGELDEGIKAFQAGLRHAPDDLALHLNLGTALRTKGDGDGAIGEFKFVLARNPDNPEVHYQYGMTLRETGRLDEALSEFETALELNPEFQEGYYTLGQTLRQIAAKLPRTPPPSAETEERTTVGLARAKSGDLDGAIEALTRAAAADPAVADIHFHLGAALWYRGEPTRAAAELDAALRLNPAMTGAASLRAIAYRDAGDPGSARRWLQRAISLDPKSAAGYLDLGLIFLRMKKLNEALGQFETGLNLPAGAKARLPDIDLAIRELRTAAAGTGDATARVVLGRLLGAAGGEARDVAAEFEAAIALRPDYAEAHNYLGLVYTQANDDSKAARAFREAIRLRPDYADAHANLGALLTATDAAESVRELERAVALRPGLLKAHYNLAIAYGASPQHGADREIAQLRKLIGLEPDYPQSDFALGKALLRKGSVPEAVVHLERAVQREPQFGEAQYQLGLALSRAGRKEEAAKRMKDGREIIAASQSDRTAALDLSEGKAALEARRFDQAAAIFQRMLQGRPEWPEAHYRLGVALTGQGDRVAARTAFARALKLDPRHAGAISAMAADRSPRDDPRQMEIFESHIRQSRFVELEPLARAYVAERPESWWGWYTLGYTLFAQRKIGDSVTALSKSLSLNVDNAEAHKVLGRNLMLIGRFDFAQREFEAGERLDPKSAEMPFNLGRLFSIQDLWLESRRAFERALAIDGAYMEAYDGLGFALEALGDDAGATTQYRKSIELNAGRRGTFASPYVNLSALQLREGKVEEALALARQAVEVNGRADRGWSQLGRAQEKAGNLAAAADALARAIQINPRVSAYYYVLANVYRRLGKRPEGQEAMDMFSKLTRETNELEEKRREFIRQEGAARD